MEPDAHERRDPVGRVRLAQFTPASEKTRVLLNDGLAALAWLALGAVVTMLIRRFALPGPRRPLRYVALSRSRVTDTTSPM